MGGSESTKKLKYKGFAIESETLVSPSHSYKCLTHRPRNIAPLPFASFPPLNFSLFSTKPNSHSGGMVHVAIHHWTASMMLMLGLTPLLCALHWSLGQMGRDTSSTEVAESQICWTHLKNYSFLKAVEEEQGGRWTPTHCHQGSRALTSLGAISN